MRGSREAHVVLWHLDGAAQQEEVATEAAERFARMHQGEEGVGPTKQKSRQFEVVGNVVRLETRQPVMNLALPDVGVDRLDARGKNHRIAEHVGLIRRVDH